MKKTILSLFMALAAVTGLQAQDDFYGVCNRWALGVGVGTEGIGIEVGTNFNKYLGARLGLNIMPGINYSDDVDIEVEASQANLGSFRNSYSMNIEGSLKRTTVDVKVDYYPTGGTFFITGGFSFGGNKIIKVKGHSEDYAQDYANYYNQYGSMAGQYGIDLTDNYIKIDDYKVPIDKNGNIGAGLKVSGFRPYLGIGVGRAVPKNRVGCRFELGVQFHGKPKFYVDNGNFEELSSKADDSVSDAIDVVESITVYPVLKFTLRGRIL